MRIFRANGARQTSLTNARNTWIGMRSRKHTTTITTYVVAYTTASRTILSIADKSARRVNRRANPNAAANNAPASGRQTTLITSAAPMPKGRPEYAMAGINVMKVNTTNATATPVG